MGETPPFWDPPDVIVPVQCMRLLCIMLWVLVPHLVWSATAWKQECPVNTALNGSQCSVCLTWAALPWQQGLSGTIPWCHWRPRRTQLSRPCPGDCPAVGATQSPGTAYSTWSASSVHWWRRCLFSCHLVLPAKIKKHHRGGLTAACLLGNEWMWKHCAKWASL